MTCKEQRHLLTCDPMTFIKQLDVVLRFFQELLNPALDSYNMYTYLYNILKWDGLPGKDMSRTDTATYLSSHDICESLR